MLHSFAFELNPLFKLSQSHRLSFLLFSAVPSCTPEKMTSTTTRNVTDYTNEHRERRDGENSGWRSWFGLDNKKDHDDREYKYERTMTYRNEPGYSTETTPDYTYKYTDRRFPEPTKHYNYERPTGTRPYGPEPRPYGPEPRPYGPEYTRPYGPEPRPYGPEPRPYNYEMTKPCNTMSEYTRPYNTESTYYTRPYYTSEYTRPYNTEYTRPYNTEYTRPYNTEYTRPYNTEYNYTRPYNTEYTRPYNTEYTRPYNTEYTRPYNTEYNYTRPYNTERDNYYTRDYNTTTYGYGREYPTYYTRF
ncbi:uncharacterized protein LOC129583821 [Paramacrobiotus metropolitanus]|uniref:uncharacterized protein LOC129583821 n=1 Tax=Paramacrobiotus metropolitanus TaxID=2943436 RepID=UPI00244583B5|nr:uncharacterized protein LOC129583821 [Paramacrobiotus metropolitanus]